jgi:uncharacterized protein YdeI (YjbR/CyaY-like superfamily)
MILNKNTERDGYMENYLNHPEVPIGLGMALAKNPAAMNHFSNLDVEGKRRIIEQTHSVRSKDEMDSLVSHITDGNSFR